MAAIIRDACCRKTTLSKLNTLCTFLSRVYRPDELGMRELLFQLSPSFLHLLMYFARHHAFQELAIQAKAIRSVLLGQGTEVAHPWLQLLGIRADTRDMGIQHLRSHNQATLTVLSFLRVCVKVTRGSQATS